MTGDRQSELENDGFNTEFHMLQPRELTQFGHNTQHGREE